MTVLTQSQLHAILPKCDSANWLQPLSAAMSAYGINNQKRKAMFLTQIGHESAQLTRLVENLNYSTEGLMGVFSKRFDTRAEASRYARQPEKIANRVYANRMGNGPEKSGDGWRYRGRGLIHLTGKKMYEAAGFSLGLPLVNNPDLLLVPEHAANSAAWFFTANIRGLEMADAQDLEGCSRAVNGGVNGMAERRALYAVACRVLGV